MKNCTEKWLKWATLAIKVAQSEVSMARNEIEDGFKEAR